MNLTHRAKLHSVEHVRFGSEADSLHRTNLCQLFNLAVLRLLVGDSRSGKKRRIGRGTTAGVPQVQKFNPDSWWLAGCKGQAYDCWFQTSAKVVEDPTMSDAKQPSKRRRRSKTLPVLGAAGLSLSLASTASAV